MACFLSCKNKQYVARHQRVRIDKKGSSHLMSQPTEPSNASVVTSPWVAYQTSAVCGAQVLT